MKRIFVLWCVLMMTPFGAAFSQEDPFADQDLFNDEPSAQGNQSIFQSAAPQVVFSGLIDVRLVQTGKAKSWNEQGRGLTRYGGTDTDHQEEDDDLGDQASTGFQLPQASLVLDVLFAQEGFDAGVFLQLNHDDHRDTHRESGRLGVFEAHLNVRKRFDTGHTLSARAGLLVPPISLEHPEVAWSTRYTITPSAINTWVGEEIKATGLELTYRHAWTPTLHSDLLFGAFSKNDTTGSILAWRGWALHDYQLTTGSRLRIQPITSPLEPQNGWAEPILEVDGKLGYYGKTTLAMEGFAKLEVFYSDNQADPIGKVDKTKDYAWPTYFTNIGLELTPGKGFSLLAQHMAGNTRMGFPSSGVNNDFSASYLLLSYQVTTHRFSVRADRFEVVDEDEHPHDPNDMEGTAQTIAYFYHGWEHFTLGIEHLNVTSERDGWLWYGDDDPDDDLTQMMARVYF